MPNSDDNYANYLALSNSIINKFSRGMVHSGRGIPSESNAISGFCNGCNKYSYQLLKHHWYEILDYKYHSILLCRSCNKKLTSSVFLPPILHQILPTWEIQKEYLDASYANDIKGVNTLKRMVHSAILDWLKPALNRTKKGYEKK